MTNEQELKVDENEIIELAEILLALQSRLPVKEDSKTKSIEATPSSPSSPVSPRSPLAPGSPAAHALAPTPITVVVAPAVEQQTADSPPSSPEAQSKKENHAPVAPVTNKRPAPVSTEQSSKRDLTEQERKKRKRVTEDQLTILETIFATDKMPDQKLRLQLAQRLGMSSRRVQIWFQNKRAKLKKSSSNSSSPSPSPIMHGKLTAAGSQALYSARFSLPSAASHGSGHSSARPNSNSTPNVNGGNGNSATTNNNTNNANSNSHNAVTSYNFPISFHPFPSPNFLGPYANPSSMPHQTSPFPLPLSRPVK